MNIKIKIFEVSSIQEAEQLINKYIVDNFVLDVVNVDFDSRIGSIIVRVVFLLGVDKNDRDMWDYVSTIS